MTKIDTFHHVFKHSRMCDLNRWVNLRERRKEDRKMRTPQLYIMGRNDSSPNHGTVHKRACHKAYSASVREVGKAHSKLAQD